MLQLIQVEQLIAANRLRRFSVADAETDLGSLALQKGLPSAKKFSNSVAFGFKRQDFGKSLWSKD